MGNDIDINYIKQTILETKTQLAELKGSVDGIRKDFDITKYEQFRDKKDFDDSFNDNLKLISTLASTINELNQNIRDPESGLIVKLNKTTEVTKQSTEILDTLLKDMTKLKTTSTNIDGRLKVIEGKFKTIRVYILIVVANLIAIITKFLWDFFKG